MELNKIYKFFDGKYSPIIGYLVVSPIGELKDLLMSMQNKTGIMRDFFGFEYEENNTVTFYDFTGNLEKSINITLSDFLIILQPTIDDYVKISPNESFLIESLIKAIQNP
jgi:hypothetical protein